MYAAYANACHGSWNGRLGRPTAWSDFASKKFIGKVRLGHKRAQAHPTHTCIRFCAHSGCGGKPLPPISPSPYSANCLFTSSYKLTTKYKNLGITLLNGRMTPKSTFGWPVELRYPRWNWSWHWDGEDRRISLETCKKSSPAWFSRIVIRCLSQRVILVRGWGRRRSEILKRIWMN